MMTDTPFPDPNPNDPDRSNPSPPPPPTGATPDSTPQPHRGLPDESMSPTVRLPGVPMIVSEDADAAGATNAAPEANVPPVIPEPPLTEPTRPPLIASSTGDSSPNPPSPVPPVRHTAMHTDAMQMTELQRLRPPRPNSPPNPPENQSANPSGSTTASTEPGAVAENLNSTPKRGSMVISTAQSPMNYLSPAPETGPGVTASGFGGPLAGQSSAPPTPSSALPIQARPKLMVLRGEKLNVQYPLYEGPNYLGRTDEKPVDIDLEDQEASDRIWTSRQHACITYQNGVLTIEDLNSLNGTFVNRMRVHPGQQRILQVNDIIQVGTVQMKVILA
ncbi:FHA domain-containing protein [Tuwongella immobilis]|nr:FHA domain-containing protein [Tuwongella immobilis]